MMRKVVIVLVFLCPALVVSTPLTAPVACAGGAPSFLDPNSFPNPLSILSSDLVNAFVKSVGLTTGHRAYEPATAMGRGGFDLSVEGSLTQLPADLNAAITAQGGSAVSLPFVPVPRINIHKGMGDRVDGGLSLIFYQSFRILGFDLKAVLSQPEEGPTWALRLKYTSTVLEIPDVITLKTSISSFAPELVISRELDFADPYMGFGYQYSTGDMTLVLPAPLPEQSATGQGGAFYAFTGVSMKIVPIGVRITLEGAYNSAGANALGTKVGFNF